MGARGGTRAAEIVAMVNGWLVNRFTIELNAVTGTYFHGTSRPRCALAAQAPQWRHGG
jgi:hypothetical protein